MAVCEGEEVGSQPVICFSPLEFSSEKVLLERRQFMQGWGGEGLGREQ